MTEIIQLAQDPDIEVSKVAKALSMGHAQVTISIGCATHGAETPFPSAAEFVKAAGHALSIAKRRGRNRSVPFDRQLSGAFARMG